MSVFDRNMRRLRYDPEPWAGSGGGQNVSVEGVATTGVVNLTGGAAGLPAGAVAVFFRQSGASPTLVGGHVAAFSGATGIAAGAPGAVPAPASGEQDNLLAGSGGFSVVTTAAGRAILAGANAAAQRASLGLGTAATHAATDFALASHTHDAADIVSGVLAIVRLATGTPTGLKFVRDDSTLAQVQYSDLASIATDKVLGRATAGTGAVELVTCTAAGRALIDDVDASAQRVTLGLGTAATHPATDFASSGLATASGLTTSVTDVVLGRSSAGGGAVQEIPCTATGRSIIAGASVAAVRATLGVAAISVEGVAAAGDLNFTGNTTGLPSGYADVFFRKNGTGPTNVGGQVAPYQVCDNVLPGVAGAVPESAAGDQAKILTAGSWWALLQTASIALNAVDFARVQQVATDTLLGRATAGTGNVETIVCTAAARSVLDDTSVSAIRTTLGLGTAATHPATDFANSGAITASGLTASATDVIVGRATAGSGALEEIACTATARSILDDTSTSAVRTTLGLGTSATHPATDFASSGLATASGLTTSATDVLIGRSTAGGGAVEEVPCTAAGRALIAGASAAAQRTTLGLGTAAVANTVDFQTEAPVRFSPGLQNASLGTAVKSITKNTTFALYMGRAPFACTSVDVLSRCTTLGSTFTWCELAICTGAVVMNGNPTLTVLSGVKSMTSIYNTTGVKNTTGIAVTIAAGADVWIAIGCNATTVPILRAASLADDLQLGYQASLATTQPSTIVGTPTAWTIEGATILPFLLGIRFVP